MDKEEIKTLLADIVFIEKTVLRIRLQDAVVRERFCEKLKSEKVMKSWLGMGFLHSLVNCEKEYSQKNYPLMILQDLELLKDMLKQGELEHPQVYAEKHWKDKEKQTAMFHTWVGEIYLSYLKMTLEKKKREEGSKTSVDKSDSVSSDKNHAISVGGSSQASAGKKREASAGGSSQASAGKKQEASAGGSNQAGAGKKREASADESSQASAGKKREVSVGGSSQASAGGRDRASSEKKREVSSGKSSDSVELQMEISAVIGKISSTVDLTKQENIDYLYDKLSGYEKEFQKTWVGKEFFQGLEERATSTKQKNKKIQFWKVLMCVFLLLAVSAVGIAVYQGILTRQSRIVTELSQENRRLTAELSAYDQAVGNAGQSSEGTDSSEGEAGQSSEGAASSEGEAGQSSEGAASSEGEAGQREILAEYAELYQLNSDMAGWIEIEGTQINYPVMQGEEDFYLHHGFDGTESKEGAIFADEGADLSGDNFIVLYGHNMKNNTMFGELDSYRNESFYREHEVFLFDTIWEKHTYEIVGVLKTRLLNQDEEGFRYYQTFGYENEEEFEEILTFMKENQIYDTGKTVEYGDELVLLSTCEYSVDNGRFVIVGRKIS